MESVPTLLEPGRAFLSKIALFLPNLLAALLILLGGWVLARFIRLLVFRFLLAIRFDVAGEKAGIDDILLRADIRQGPAELVATLAYWVMMLLGVMTAINPLGLAAVAELLNQVLLYIPKVIAAVVVLILGLFFANFLAGVIRTAAANAGLREAEVRRQQVKPLGDQARGKHQSQEDIAGGYGHTHAQDKRGDCPK